jgi:predicted nucleic acid-binding Zn ribbon protein
MTMQGRRPRKAEKPKESPQLGAVLEEFLRSSGLVTLMRHPAVHEAWQKTVGPELAEHTRILGFRHGTLEVAVASSALMNDIQFHRAAILQDLQASVRKPFISRIQFVLKSFDQEDD